MHHALDAVPAGYSQVSHRYGPYGPSKLIVARCPARFQGRYILKDKIVWESVNAARGSAIHLVFQHITEAHVKGETVSPAQLNTWIEEAVGRYPAAYDQIQLVKEAAEKYVGNQSRYENASSAPEIRCELELGVALYEEESFLDDSVPNRAYVKTHYSTKAENGWDIPNPNAFFGGKLDKLVIDHEVKIATIIDHKSTPNASENSDNNFQMGCYAWLVSLYYPGYQVRSVIHFAHPMLNFYAPPVDWTAEDLDDVEDEVRMRVRAIESFREYPALPGSHCNYCHMVQECPEYKAVEAQNARGDINLNVHGISDLVRIARQVKVTGELYDLLNKTLKVGIETFAPTSGVAIEGFWYGFKPGNEKVDWDATERKIKEEVERAKARPDDPDAQRLVQMGDLEGILTAHGVSPESYKHWKGDKLKSLMKLNKPELIQQIQKFVVLDRETRFGGYKN